MKFNSLKFKIVGISSIIIILLVSSIIINSVVKFDKYVDSSINTNVIKANDVLKSKIEEMKKSSTNNAVQLSLNPLVIKSIETKNTEEILKTIKPLISSSDIEFITVCDKNGIVIARTHEPNQKGDSVINQENVKIALEGKVNSQVEKGTAVKLSSRAGAPVKSENGEIIGVISTGYRLDSNNIVDYIKTNFDCDSTIFLDDTRISTTIMKDGKRIIGTKLNTDISKIVHANNKYTGNADILGMKYTTSYSTILDGSSKIVGIVFTGKNTEESSLFKRNFISNAIIVSAIFLIILILVLYMYIHLNISKPLKKAVEHFKILAKGDFTTKVSQKNLKRKDEIGELANAILIMKSNLVILIKGIMENSQEMGASSEELSSTSEEFNSMVQNINFAIENIVSGIHETNSSSQQIAASMEEVNTSIIQLSDKSIKGSENATKAKERTDDVQQKGRLYLEETEKLYKEKEYKIIKAIEEGKVVENIKIMADTIASIAEQTNLLSLNASIEAARAGEHGKGFAVVAEEVRKLADQSSQAVVAIYDTISKVQGAFKTLSDNSNEVMKFIKENVNPHFNSIVEMEKQTHNDAEFVSIMSEEVAAMSEELTATVSQVTGSVEAMSNVTQKSFEESEIIKSSSNETAKAVEHITETAENQAEIARRLNEMIEKFKI